MAEVARLGLAVAGAAVGSYIGGPIGGQIGFALGSVIGNLIFGGGPGSVIEGPRLNDLKVMSSAPGRPRPILYGTMRLGGNVFWSTDLEEHSVENTQGGKGGPTSTSVSFIYLGNFAVALCEGPVEGLIKIFADGKLLADYTNQTGPILDGSINVGDVPASEQPNVRFYKGTSDQAPDPLIQSDLGVEDTPSFRGTCYVVFENLPLADYGNRIPQITCVVTTNATAPFPSAHVNATLFDDLSQAVWQPGRQFLVAFTQTAGASGVYEFVRYHAPSQTIITEATLPNVYLGNSGGQGLNVAVDGLGNLYILELGFGGGDGSSHVTKVDGQTFASLGATEVIDVGGFPGGSVSFDCSQILVTGLSSFTQYVLLLGAVTQAGSKYAIVGTQAADSILPVIVERDLDDSAALFGVSPTPTIKIYDAAIDADGNAWLVCRPSGTSDIALVQIAAGTGAIIGGPFLVAGYSGSGEVLAGYDPLTNSILVLSEASGWMFRWSIDDQAVAAENLALAISLLSDNYSQMRAGPWNGSLWLNGDSDNKFELDTVTLAVRRTIDTGDWGVATLGGGFLYDASTHAVMGVLSSQTWWLFLDRIDGGGVSLASIVNDISERVGITSALRDTTELTDTVHGYVVPQRMTARAAVDPLVAAYFFDGVENDFQVTFPKRGRATVAALTEDDIGADPDPNASRPYLTETRREEVELLARMEVTAALSLVDYQPHSEYAKRAEEAVSTARQGTLELPIAFDNTDEIAQIADKLLWIDWATRSQYGIATPLKHVCLNPTDVITVTTDGSTLKMRPTETTLGANGVIALDAESELTAAYTSYAEGHDPEGVPVQTIDAPSPLAFQLLDTPLLRDQDNGPILYHAAGTYGGASFPGALVEKSADGFAYMPSSVIQPSRNATIGFATGALADAPGGRWTTWDRDNSVTVRLFRGSLASATELEVLNFANAAILGDELIQFATATLNADGSYTLSTLLRGRRGTEWACATHAANERFVLLQDTTVLAVVTPLTERLADRVYRATPLGGSLSQSVQRDLAWTAASLKPYAPCSVAGSRGGSPEDWTFTWLRRTRVGGAWLDFHDVPLGEASADFQVDVAVSGSPSFFTMTATPSAGGSWVDVTNQRALLTEADQRALFGAPQANLSVTVYQLSQDVGRGFGRTAALVG